LPDAWHLYLVQAEVEDMIWEVDEDCDGTVNWPELQACWQRCQEDKAGNPGCFMFTSATNR
jgi:hypothetical protein